MNKSVGRKYVSPFNGINTLKEFFKCRGTKFRKFYQNSVSRSEFDIRFCYICKISSERHTSVFGHNILVTEVCQFSCRNAFYSESRCRDYFKRFHNYNSE